MKDDKIKINFAAIDPYVESNIAKPTEIDTRKGYITWGEDNLYPQYLKDLYCNVATLHSIIEGTVDYVTGNGVKVDDVIFDLVVNDRGDTVEDLLTAISRDFLIFGGFSINVVRTVSGQNCLYHIPFERLRSDEHNTCFYYSKEWNKSWGRVKTIRYPKYDPASNEPSSVFYYNNDKSNTYPTPIWRAAVLAAEIEKNVSEFHLNTLANGFSASYFVHLHNGVPNDEQKEEIEEYFTDKFTGFSNAGRILFSFDDDKEHGAEVTKLDIEDYGEKYKSLVERSKQELFTSFRALPQLFGINLNTGFNTQEYEEAFKLYNRTAVRPIQNLILDKVNSLLGKKITIIPFTLDGEKENNITAI